MISIPDDKVFEKAKSTWYIIIIIIVKNHKADVNSTGFIFQTEYYYVIWYFYLPVFKITNVVLRLHNKHSIAQIYVSTFDVTLMTVVYFCN